MTRVGKGREDRFCRGCARIGTLVYGTKESLSGGGAYDSFLGKFHAFVLQSSGPCVCKFARMRVSKVAPHEGTDYGSRNER